MRVSVAAVLFLASFFVVEPVQAQPKKETTPAKPTSRSVVANLETPMKSALPGDSMRMSELLELVAHDLGKQGRSVAIHVDDESYREENQDFDLANIDIRVKNLPANATVMHVLRHAVKQMPVKSTFVIRAGKVEILPVSRTSREYLLNQTVRAEFSERRLDLALEELSELTGVTIVLDVRAKQRVSTAVSARFHDDIALQDAVRLLTDMAELKVVYLVTGLYVTTPEHAKVMQKELKEIYQPTPPANLLMPGAIGPGQAPDPSFVPSDSPLAPPLPPSKRRDPAAA